MCLRNEVPPGTCSVLDDDYIPQLTNGRIIACGGPRQVLGPYGRAYEPTGHLRDSVKTFWDSASKAVGILVQRLGFWG